MAFGPLACGPQQISLLNIKDTVIKLYVCPSPKALRAPRPPVRPVGEKMPGKEMLVPTMAIFVGAIFVLKFQIGFAFHIVTVAGFPEEEAYITLIDVGISR